MIRVFGTYLLLYCTLDFAASVFYQLPVFSHNQFLRGLGLRKIYELSEANEEFPFTYEGMVRASHLRNINEFSFNTVNFFTLCLTVFMIQLVMF